MDSYSVELAKSAEKELRRIDGRYVPRIFAAIESLAQEPRPVGCKKLSGSDHTYRIRLSLINIAEPTRLGMTAYAVFCL